MSALVILLSAAALLSFSTTFVLVFSGLPVPVYAELAGILAGISCFAALSVHLLYERTPPANADFSVDVCSETVPFNVQSMLIGIRKKIAASSDSVKNILDYPFLARVLMAKNEEEFAASVLQTHEQIEYAENILAALSDHMITDTLILLPLADAIIKAVPGKTEEAAMVVLENFMVVRDASSHAAESARNLRAQLESGNEKSVSYAAELSRNAVRNERGVIRELANSTKENRAQLQLMSEEISSGLAILKNINEITEQSKLIAFNMSVEAARIGEKGQGFKVIISELHKLNERTFTFSKEVASLLSRFRQYTTILVDNMEKKSVAVITEVEKGMDAAESAVESLIEASSRTEAFTKEIAGMSESIDHDLDKVLESLQFQDITRQMIEGAMVILEDLKKTLDDCLSRNEIRVDESRMQDRFITIKNKLISNAKTKGEKEALMEVRV